MKKKYEIRDRDYGATSPAILVEILNETTGLPVNLSNADIDIWFRSVDANGEVYKEIDLTDGITATDLANGKYTIDSFLCEFPIGWIYYDDKITFDSGDIKYYTYCKFQVIESGTD